jgi:hypothetical protein
MATAAAVESGVASLELALLHQALDAQQHKADGQTLRVHTTHMVMPPAMQVRMSSGNGGEPGSSLFET